jgi:hypothetical protein
MKGVVKMANGFMFFVDGKKGGDSIEFLMKKGYAKGFAQDLLEAIDKMAKSDEDIVFTFHGRPLAKSQVLLEEIKENSRRIITH